MTRPLLVCDCDEVLLHMLVPFRAWLDEVHGIHFDFDHGDFAEALRHKDSGELVLRETVWTLLAGFFETEMHRQYPIAGAVEVVTRLARDADVVILTNIGAEAADARAAQLAACGLPFPVIGNRGGKGRPLAALVAQYAPSVILFIDDLGFNHESVAAFVPGAWRLHMVGEPQMAPRIATAPHAHARIDDWASAESWIAARFAEGLAPPAPSDLDPEAVGLESLEP